MIDVPAVHQTEKAIAECEETKLQSFRAILELAKATAKATNDLYSARVTKRTEEQKRKLTAEKESLKRQR
eukprot:3804241-Pyramimonas_sp.AAC.1